jgi:putative ubiquitin-RnfH superfamily antitoxin RatB of RatAB toxin-antitoxin module
MIITLTLALGPRDVMEWTTELAPGTHVSQALRSLPWRRHVPKALAGELQISIWGRAAQADTPLRAGDRIELTRPLRVDPKVARRERFNAQGKRTAGLFARRRR